MPLLFITRSPREGLRTRSATASRCDRAWGQPCRGPRRRRARGRTGAAPSTRAECTSPGTSITESPRRRMSTSSARGPHRAPPRRPASCSSRFASASSSHGDRPVAARTARLRNHGWYDRPNGSLAYIRETASSSVSRESRSTASRILRTRLPWLVPRRRTALGQWEDLLPAGGHSRFSRRSPRRVPRCQESPLAGIPPTRSPGRPPCRKAPAACRAPTRPHARRRGRTCRGCGPGA